MPTGTTWNHELVDQMEWHWSQQARPRLDGLTDDEYRWEPVTGCWNIRADGDGTTIDYEYPTPHPPPFATIAWRMGHVSIGIFGARAANHFGEPDSVTYESTEWPLTAAGGLELLDRHHRVWTEGVRSLGEAGLSRPCGPSEDPFADRSLAALVLHINREAIHHLAEIALLRDLYRDRSTLTATSAQEVRG